MKPAITAAPFHVLKIALLSTAIIASGCATKPPQPKPPTASSQLGKLVEVIELIEQSRPESTDNGELMSGKMKSMINELGSDIDNIDDPKSQKIAIARFLEFVDGKAGTENNLLSGIFGILTRQD